MVCKPSVVQLAVTILLPELTMEAKRSHCSNLQGLGSVLTPEFMDWIGPSDFLGPGWLWRRAALRDQKQGQVLGQQK